MSLARTFTAGGTDRTREAEKYMWLKKHIISRGAPASDVAALLGTDQLKKYAFDNGFLRHAQVSEDEAVRTEAQRAAHARIAAQLIADIRSTAPLTTAASNPVSPAAQPARRGRGMDAHNVDLHDLTAGAAAESTAASNGLVTVPAPYTREFAADPSWVMKCSPDSDPSDRADPRHPCHCQIMCVAPSGGTLSLTRWLSSANNSKKLRAHPAHSETKTTCVLNCTRELPMKFPKHFEYMKLDIGDAPNFVIHTSRKLSRSVDGIQVDEFVDYSEDGAQFQKVCSWLDEKVVERGEHVVVHCAAGGSRSAAFVILYLMHSAKIGAQQAFKYCQGRRSNECPNCGFLEQLQRWEDVGIDYDAPASVALLE